MSPDLPSPQSPPGRWQRLSASLVRAFHAYANWLVGISWKRFFVLAILLMLASALVQSLPPFSWTVTETIRDTGDARPPPVPPTPPGPKGAPGSPKSDAVDISIDESGIRIRSRARAAAAAGASAAASSASAPASGASSEIDIRLPPGIGREARQKIVEAIEEDRQADIEAQAEAAEAQAEAAAELRRDRRAKVRTREVHWGGFLTQLALLWIVGSIILKATYKGRVQAEVKAAQATETAESESLKRQVVEARMAAMQAQVEPHFLFNTLASIDHLIETDPKRASTMQKNLIALLRASMPALRENQPNAHNLGREMAVIRPYLEILKVRMEDRLRTEVQVPTDCCRPSSRR